MRGVHPYSGWRLVSFPGWGLVWALSCIWSSAAFAAEKPAVEADPASIIRALALPEDEQIEFTQTQLNPLLKRPSQQQGTLSRTAAEGLVMRVIDPRPEVRALHQGTVSLTREVRNRRGVGTKTITRRLQLDPSRPSHLALFALDAFLSGEEELLHEHFHLAARTTAAGWLLTLEPKAAAVRQQLSRLLFRGHAHVLSSFRTERDDGQGGISHYLEVVVASPATQSTSGR